MVEIYEYPKGYSAKLFGKSSMTVYRYGKEVLHTAYRSVNSNDGVMDMLKNMPDFMKLIMGGD